jgi:hypothetical protein
MLPVWPRNLLAKLLKHYVEADPIQVFGIVLDRMNQPGRKED